jgi:hypothetical protein
MKWIKLSAANVEYIKCELSPTLIKIIDLSNI